ncbi:CDP-alcohol phosphatidyltransferase family protein [Rhodopirellula europaea]|jgi:CDP-diacylglycerol--glycerol-3-phosphate 3-phosphatidyltransferase|uniref:CDP-diacylglycerol--glycerol-3-phosphate 3-phosphatidyltransferase n=1 Tax=Rhodopirellula europaea SH398 TaxID=1263868 RepID=M5S2A9_9BACT|nr:CDP-alcohol phosphatidyltransferase family protein [Rhodopirellula europaea]EMI25606.1 CDP-diacylglycerol--glycerol-3-phosphate 3-phosphatidyltransferase [Rhodopirellula europaea SH398]
MNNAEQIAPPPANRGPNIPSGDGKPNSTAPEHGTSNPVISNLTVPNIICVLRALLSPFMVLLAWNDQAQTTLILFIVLTLSDTVDGKIARWLDQRTEIGPKLDSIADAAMYVCLALSLLFLRADLLANEAIWIAAAIGSFIAAECFALLKFGKLPTYHTRTAKTAWLLVGIAAVNLLIGGPAWPLHIAMASVIVANIESGLLTYSLKKPVSDVTSIFHVRGKQNLT